MEVLLVGCTGFIGRHVLRELGRRGHTVVCGARRGSVAKARELGAHGVVEYRLESPPRLRPQALVYMPGVIGVFKPHYRVHVLGVRRAVEAYGGSIESLVYMSAATVHGYRGVITETSPYRPVSRYDRSKVEGEREALRAREAGARVALVRPTLVIGPYSSAAGAWLLMRRLSRLLLPVPRGRIPAVCVGDVARLVALALERGDGPYLANGGYLSLGEIARGVGGRRVLELPRHVAMPAALLGSSPLAMLARFLAGAPEYRPVRASSLIGGFANPAECLREMGAWLRGFASTDNTKPLNQ